MNYRRWVAIAALGGLLVTACGEDDDNGGSSSAPTTNACPVDGCEIIIVDADPAGTEIMVTWEANFAPDFAKNHIHFYWDTYTAEQVSGDAETKYEVEQGNWVPTDSMPNMVTEGPTSVEAREGSSTLCVTAADFDHNVLDPALVNCLDVSDLL
ncbi:MAG: hypothetical protein OEU32_04030 [Acidimicrobiia bacterium]|nr:hypothetical protein [Acidimicrobiia bacterium]